MKKMNSSETGITLLRMPSSPSPSYTRCYSGNRGSLIRRSLQKFLRIIPSLLVMLFVVSLVFVTLMQIAVIHSNRNKLLAYNSQSSQRFYPESSSQVLDDKSSVIPASSSRFILTSNSGKKFSREEVMRALNYSDVENMGLSHPKLAGITVKTTSASSSSTASPSIKSKKEMLRVEALLDRSLPSRDHNVKMLQNFVNSARIKQIIRSLQEDGILDSLPPPLLYPSSPQSFLTNSSFQYDYHNNKDGGKHRDENQRNELQSGNHETFRGREEQSLDERTSLMLPPKTYTSNEIMNTQDVTVRDNSNKLRQDPSYKQETQEVIQETRKPHQSLRQEVVKSTYDNDKNLMSSETFSRDHQAFDGSPLTATSIRVSDITVDKTHEVESSQEILRTSSRVITENGATKRGTGKDSKRNMTDNGSQDETERTREARENHTKIHLDSDAVIVQTSSTSVGTNFPSRETSAHHQKNQKELLHQNLISFNSNDSHENELKEDKEEEHKLLQQRNKSFIHFEDRADPSLEQKSVSNKKSLNEKTSLYDHLYPNLSSLHQSSSILPSIDNDPKEIKGISKIKKPLCPLIPPGLIGRIEIHLQPDVGGEEMKHVIDMNPQVKAGGSFAPSSCYSRHRVAIIIPYRDRLEHLEILLYHLHPVLQRQQLEYTLYVIEQAGNDTFNKGVLMNAGAREALKDNDFHCFIFHDVDLIPEDDRNLYSCPFAPRHMSYGVDKFNYTLPYNYLVGGVFAISKEHLIQVNGYSNLYWGWGAEDDDMAHRLKLQNLQIIRPPASIGRYTMIKHNHRAESPSSVRTALLRMAKRRASRDGLTSVRYSVVFKELKPLFTHVMIEIGHIHKWHFPSPNKLVLHF